MKTPVTALFLEEFPVHDADFELRKVVLTGPSLQVQLAVQLHPDAPIDSLRQFGITSRSFILTFDECLRVVMNMIGINSRKETIHGWGVLKESDLLLPLKSTPFGKGTEHHRIEFSGGSRMDFLTTDVFIEEAQ